MTDIQATLAEATTRLETLSDSALLDAEVLLCQVLDKPRSHLRAWPEKQLNVAAESQFWKLLEQRQQGVPIAYLTGKKEFWSRDFNVSPDVLIPRPDTELLIELCLKLLENQQNSRLIDLGTGSGIIAITLAAERPEIEIVATDLSDKALDIAKANAKIHKVNNIRFKKSSWFNEITQNEFDLVISNPPYIASNDVHLTQGDLRFEPDSALISENQGLQDIQTIIKQARQHLKSAGRLLIEHGFDQALAVQELFAIFLYQKIKTHTDLAGNPRVTTGQWFK